MILLYGGYTYFSGLRMQEAPQVGKLLPSIPVVSLERQRVLFDSVIDRKCVLIFFSVSCPPCRQEIVSLNMLYPEFKDSLRIIAISLSSFSDTFRFIDIVGISFPVFIDTAHTSAKVLHINAVPTILFINNRGVLADYRTGEIDIRRLRSIISNFVKLKEDSIATSL